MYVRTCPKLSKRRWDTKCAWLCWWWSWPWWPSHQLKGMRPAGASASPPTTTSRWSTEPTAKLATWSEKKTKWWWTQIAAVEHLEGVKEGTLRTVPWGAMLCHADAAASPTTTAKTGREPTLTSAAAPPSPAAPDAECDRRWMINSVYLQDQIKEK